MDKQLNTQTTIASPASVLYASHTYTQLLHVRWMHKIVLVIDKHWATKHSSSPDDSIATTSVYNMCVCPLTVVSTRPGIKHSPHTHTHSIHITHQSSTMYVNYSMSWHNNNIPIIIIILLSLLLIIDSEIIGHILHTKTRYC